MTISEKIVAVRTQLNLSQDGFSKLIGVTRQAVSRWEKDEASPDVKRLMQICDAAGITIDEFLSDDFAYGEEAVEKREEKKRIAEQEELTKQNNLRRSANIKCTGIIFFKVATILAALVAAVAIANFCLRFVFSSVLGFENAADNVASWLLPTIFLILSSGGICGVSPLLFKSMRAGTNNPFMAIIAILGVDVAALAYGILYGVNLAPAETAAFAVLKILSFVNVLYALQLFIFNGACVLFFVDSIELAPYNPLPQRENEKYLIFAYIAGIVVGFLGTPVFWAAGFIVRSEIIKRTPVFAGKFTQSLVGGAIGEVVAIVLFCVIMYIVQAF